MFDRRVLNILFGLSLILANINLVFASLKSDVEDIVAMKTAPKGVVFELMENKETDIRWSIEEITQAAEVLRQKFPKLPIVVVSHGAEMLALSKSHKRKYSKVHSLVQQMQLDNVNVQVCGTFASWQQKSAADFPDYVSVVDEAPAQIEWYRDAGYIHLELDKDNKPQ